MCINWSTLLLVFDASSLIHAWGNYPEPQFPGLWEWIASQFIAGEFVLPSIAHTEVGYKAPDCVEWLKTQGVNNLAVNNEIVQEAFRIKNLLGIVDDLYSAKGVDENDLLIIASAKVNHCKLCSEEAQPTGPKLPANMKIPAVCKLESVTVPCLNFIELIKESEVVFR